MEKEKQVINTVSRRRFINLTAAATLSVVPVNFNILPAPQGSKGSKPNSKFGGVQIGAITYSWRSMPGTAKDTLQYCLKTGISSIELMGNVAEEYAGLPSTPARPPRNATAEEKSAYANAAKGAGEEQRKWRISAPMKKFQDLRKMFNNEGVQIHIVKFSAENWSDEEIDYAFRAAKALGAKGVSTEIGDKSAKVLGPFAKKYNLYNILHQHLQPGEPGWTFDKFLEMSPSNMLNFDVGHYFGATGLHPNGILERLHNRIVSIHLKDKTGPKGNPPNTNMPWGKGETPIADILLLIKKNKWPINADIELEYPVPENSDAVKEVLKCVDYCKRILV